MNQITILTSISYKSHEITRFSWFSTAPYSFVHPNGHPLPMRRKVQRDPRVGRQDSGRFRWDGEFPWKMDGLKPERYGKSQFLIRISPCLMGKSPFLIGMSPILMGKSPFWMGISPFWMCTSLWRETHFQVKMYKTRQRRTTFGSWCRKSARWGGARSTFPSQCTKHTMFGPFLKVQMWFCVAGARDSACSHKWAERAGFVALPKTMASVGHGSGKMKFTWQAQYKRHIHQRCSEVRALISWEGLHFGASDLQVC